MKKSLFSVFGICFLMIAAPSYGEILRLVVDEWPPYIESESPDNGYMTEIVRSAFAASGIEIRLDFRPWKRVETEVDKEKKISYGWIRNEARAEKWHYSQAFLKGSSVFAVLKDKNFSWKVPADLSPYKIGITRGYSYGDEFDKYSGKLDIEIANTDEVNFRKLLTGRIDLFAVNPVVGAGILRKKYKAGERARIRFVMEPPVIRYDTHLICARNYDRCPYYIRKFNQGLAVIMKNGRLKEIMEAALSLD